MKRKWAERSASREQWSHLHSESRSGNDHLFWHCRNPEWLGLFFMLLTKGLYWEAMNTEAFSISAHQFFVKEIIWKVFEEVAVKQYCKYSKAFLCTVHNHWSYGISPLQEAFFLLSHCKFSFCPVRSANG